MEILIFKLLPVILSGIIGWYLDSRNIMQSPACFWALGCLTGIFLG